MVRRRPALLVSLGIVAASLALAELGARVFVLPGYWRPLPPFGALTNARQAEWLERQRSELDGRAEPEGIGVFDAELGWANRPGARTADGLYTVHAGGWRGPRDYSHAAVPPAVRVACFGESFTFGHDVPDDATWEAAVEALEPRFELVNMGVGGYGTDQALLLAMRELPRLSPELVLVGLLLENIGRNVTRYRPLWVPQSDSPVAKPRFVLEGGELALVPLPFRERSEFVAAVESGAVLELLREHEHWSAAELPRLLGWSALARLVRARRAYAERDVPDLWKRPGEPFAVTLALLERFRALAVEHGARDAVVLVFPSRYEVHDRRHGVPRYWTTLLDALEERGIPHLDLCDALCAAGVEVYELYGAGGHLTRTGNEIVARAVLEELRERFPGD